MTFTGGISGNRNDKKAETPKINEMNRRNKRKKGKRKGQESEVKKIRIKKPNKIILRKIQDEKDVRRILAIAIPIFILIILSPLLYRLIVLDYILPKYGKETEAVLAGKTANRWGSDRMVNRYCYAFSVDGKVYTNGANLLWEEPPVHLGDTVKVIYLECFPSINLQVKEEESD